MIDAWGMAKSGRLGRLFLCCYLQMTLCDSTTPVHRVRSLRTEVVRIEEKWMILFPQNVYLYLSFFNRIISACPSLRSLYIMCEFEDILWWEDIHEAADTIHNAVLAVRDAIYPQLTNVTYVDFEICASLYDYNVAVSESAGVTHLL